MDFKCKVCPVGGAKGKGHGSLKSKGDAQAMPRQSACWMMLKFLVHKLNFWSDVNLQK